MEPVPGPGQHSPRSSLSAARVGLEDADSWEPSRLVTGSVSVLTSPPPPPMCTHTHTQTCLCMQRCSHLCRCRFKCLYQMHHLCMCVPPKDALKYHSNSAKPSPYPPALAQLVGLVEQDWPEGYPIHPLCLGSASWNSVLRTPV